MLCPFSLRRKKKKSLAQRVVLILGLPNQGRTCTRGTDQATEVGRGSHWQVKSSAQCGNDWHNPSKFLVTILKQLDRSAVRKSNGQELTRSTGLLSYS